MDRLTLLPTALLLLAMAACSPEPPEPASRDLQTQGTADPAGNAAPPTSPADDSGPPPAALDPCDPSGVQALVGEQATDEVIEQARIDAGAQIVRTLRPDQVVTMEYRAGRLNIDVDDTGTITGLRCG